MHKNIFVQWRKRKICIFCELGKKISATISFWYAVILNADCHLTSIRPILRVVAPFLLGVHTQLPIELAASTVQWNKCPLMARRCTNRRKYFTALLICSC